MVSPLRAISLGKEYISWKYKLATKYKEQPRTALASFPRSGNTWLRVLIENSTNEATGSIYQDRVFERSAEGIIIKTHARDSFKYNRAIVLVRNPLDAFISHYKWRQDFGNRAEIDWEEHINRCIKLWGNFYKHWSKVTYSHTIIHYEHLRRDPMGTLSSIINFLGRDIPDIQLQKAISEASLDKLRKNKETNDNSKFFNQGKINEGVSKFSAKELALIRKELGSLSTNYGYTI